MAVKVYLASRYSRREELAGYAKQLRQLGFEITSRWLDGSHEVPGDGLSEERAYPTEFRQKFAQEDYDDLVAAHIVISFTEPPRTTHNRGGRHVEFGAALALLKRVIVVEHRENVFHCLPQVEFYQTWEQTLETLRREAGVYACQ